ncbi:peptide-N-glycosidase F-related protein [Flavobacterium sp. RHBU_24]|uniref:peptide-N-glycosidase F-related protein n=1 Tax=Flavobacterium sp. RHBU_24 TaxID=3391185 RepID=UPI003985374C
MKKTLLTLSLLTSLFAFKAKAQVTVPVYEDAIYYGMYEGTVSTPVPEGAQRNTNSSYGKKLTEEQIASFGSSLTLNVSAASNCDNYDRIGNVNLAFVPKGATSYNYTAVERIEIARFITPFMVPDGNVYVPFTWDVSNVLDILHDPELSTTYDFWVELEIYGYQGGPGQGGAAVEYPAICTGRNDVYRGSLEFVSEGTYVPKNTYFEKLSHKFELKDYVLATETNNQGTDELNETVRTIPFTVPEGGATNAKFYFINSNHGSGTNGEEYVRRWHYVFLDGVQKLSYRPGGVSCVPFFEYNTQPNCIYYLCDGTSNTRPDTNSAWSWNNWCPGDKIPTRVINLGALTAGAHEFKIDIPSAVFFNNDGYFPMSVYVQGETATAGTDSFNGLSFTMSPNPAKDIVTITTNGDAIQSFSVINTIGQVVLKGSGTSIDMRNLQNGVYMVKAEFNNGRQATKKIVKE